MAYKGVSRQEEVKSSRRKRDSRRFSQKYQEYFKDYYSSTTFLVLAFIALIIIAGFFSMPFGAEFCWIIYIFGIRKYFNFDKQSFDFPFRIPKLANVLDGSYNKPQLGEGITYLGNESNTNLPIFSATKDLSAHMLVLGTTGSGKTVFLTGLSANALVQNTGLLYTDGKGGTALIADIYQLARRLGREDDLCLINFITSGRDFIDKQTDKITNNINLMASTSSGMLIETIIGLMDDAGGGNDMWKGRAIAFVAALTRPLCYLRDKGFIRLSAETYLHFFELPNLEILLYEPEKLYPQIDKEEFKDVVAALKAYIINLPGYNDTFYSQNKRQEQKTLEQHGFITMQLTRVFNDLTYSYGHIFKSEIGEVDFFDVVLNRRILIVLLPSSERAPESLKMLGKLILGNIKQMMAGCLGNQVEGQTRTLISNGPTSSPIPFYMILDEYGYYTVVGFANLAAQARSLGFSITFASQDFSSLKRSNAEEADSTWENTNMRIIGRITSGTESETWRRINGAAGTAYIANLSAFERETGLVSDKLYASDNVGISNVDRLNYDDLAGQENGEFTFLIGKKESGGKEGGVRVIRGKGFYVQPQHPKEMRLNDLIPVHFPQKDEIQPLDRIITNAVERIKSPYVASRLTSSQFCKSISSLTAIMQMYELMAKDNSSLQADRPKQSYAILFWLLNKFNQPREIGSKGHLFKEADAGLDVEKILTIQELFNQSVSGTLQRKDNKHYKSDAECFELQKNDDSENSIINLANDNEEIYAPKTEINIVDPIEIEKTQVEELYTALEPIKLFKSSEKNRRSEKKENNTVQTDNDLANRDQIRSLHYVCNADSQNPNNQPCFELADQEFETMNSLIREQTNYLATATVQDYEFADVENIVRELELLTSQLDLETTRMTENLNKNKN